MEDDDDELVLGDSTDKHGLSKWTEALISRRIAVPENACIGEWVDACPEIPPHLLAHGARGAVRLVQRRRKMQASMGATGAHGAQYFSAIEALWLSDYGQLWLRKTATAVNISSEVKTSSTKSGSKRLADDKQTGDRMDKRAKLQDATLGGLQTWGIDGEEEVEHDDNDESEEDGFVDEDDVTNEDDDHPHYQFSQEANTKVVIESQNGLEEAEDRVNEFEEELETDVATEIAAVFLKSDGRGHDVAIETLISKDISILPEEDVNDALPVLPPSASSASFEDNATMSTEMDLSLYYTFEDAYMFLASRVPLFDEFLVYSQLRAASFAVVLHKGTNNHAALIEKDGLVPSFDVYARDGITSFRPSAPGPPDFFVVVAKSSDSLPGPFSLDRSIDRLQEYNAGLRLTQSMWISTRKKADTNAVDTVEMAKTNAASIAALSTSMRYSKPLIKCAIVSHSVVTFFALAGVELATPTSRGGRGRGRGRGRGGRGGRSRGRGRR